MNTDSENGSNSKEEATKSDDPVDAKVDDGAAGGGPLKQTTETSNKDIGNNDTGNMNEDDQKNDVPRQIDDEDEDDYDTATETVSSLPPMMIKSTNLKEQEEVSDIASSAFGGAASETARVAAASDVLLSRFASLRVNASNSGDAALRSMVPDIAEEPGVSSSQSNLSKTSRVANRLLANRRSSGMSLDGSSPTAGSFGKVEDFETRSLAPDRTKASSIWKPQMPTSPQPSTDGDQPNENEEKNDADGAAIAPATASQTGSTYGSTYGNNMNNNGDDTNSNANANGSVIGSPNASVVSASGSAVTSTTMASSTALRSLRRLRGNRQRTPGGAAAKLVGRVPVDDAEASQASSAVLDDHEPAVVEAPISELDALRQKAKDEFSVGTSTNRRYHQPTAEQREAEAEHSEKAASEVSVPSILNRSEVFHHNATAAVLSLLNSRSKTAVGGSAANSMAGDGQSVRTTPRANVSGNGDLFASDSHTTMHTEPLSAFQPPKRSDDDDAYSVRSSLTIGTSAMSTVRNQHAAPRGPIEKPLISTTTEQRVEAMAMKMKDPSKTLTDLLAAIASPEDGKLTRGYMVRRKNACGALQVLTAKAQKRISICWTVGVLPALTSVLNDDLEIPETDKPTRNEYVEARKRAIASLLNLSTPKENRLPLFHSPGLVPALVGTIENDDQESCRGSCAVLAYLAKTVDNRLLMVQVPGLIKAITCVIQPPRRDIMIVDRNHRRGASGRARATSHGQSSTWSDDESTLLSSDTYGDQEKDSPSATLSMMSTYAESKASDSDSDSEMDKALSFSEQGGVDETIRDMVKRYENDPNVFLRGARTNVFALLSHLVKEKDNAYHLTRHLCLVEALVQISKLHGGDSHTLAIRLLAHLTRHRANSKEIVFNLKSVVPVFVNATFSNSDDSRKYACFALQNLTQDKPCRQELAVIPNLLTALCVRARQSLDPEERLAAIHALKNLTDEPANLIPMTNTPECFATLMQIAHASDDSITEMMQYLGCDALATLSHWFRSIATSGQRIEAMKTNVTPSKDLFVPTLNIITYEQWE